MEQEATLTVQKKVNYLKGTADDEERKNSGGKHRFFLWMLIVNLPYERRSRKGGRGGEKKKTFVSGGCSRIKKGKVKMNTCVDALPEVQRRGMKKEEGARNERVSKGETRFT